MIMLLTIMIKIIVMESLTILGQFNVRCQYTYCTSAGLSGTILCNDVNCEKNCVKQYESQNGICQRRKSGSSGPSVIYGCLNAPGSDDSGGNVKVFSFTFLIITIFSML
jgi:hypothetical protein